MPQRVPTVIKSAHCAISGGQPESGISRRLTRPDLFRGQVIVEALLREVPVVTETIPLASGLDIHINPVVKDHRAVWVIGYSVSARRSGKCRLGWQVHRPALRVVVRNKFASDALESLAPRLT